VNRSAAFIYLRFSINDLPIMSGQENTSIAGLIAEAAQTLAKAGVTEARREAMSLVEHVTARDRTFIITHPSTILSPPDVRRLRELVEHRAARVPLQYLTGHQEFYGLDFEVTPDVLIPRPETELLVEVALGLLSQVSEPKLVCDVGTGSGCISVALLHEDAQVRAIGLDISTGALSVAARNAARHGVREQLWLIASDCFAALDSHGARFTMIVSNPPYVTEDALDGLQPEVRDHEPHVALTPGGDGLRIIQRLVADAPRFLERGGHLLMEIGFDQHEAVRQLIDSQVWQLLDIRKDLQGIPRIVVLRKR
jgi:release factor glutamine methyltransferase